MHPALQLFVSYLVTGIAITVYDFAAPPLHAKGYVNARNYRAAMFVALTWPYAVAFEAWQLGKLDRGPVRYVAGVFLLLIGFLIWSRLIYLASALVFDSVIVNTVASLVVSIAISPILAALLMPGHS